MLGVYKGMSLWITAIGCYLYSHKTRVNSMSDVGSFSAVEFEHRFPVNLGGGIRAALLMSKDRVDPVGALIAHGRPDPVMNHGSLILCACAVWWTETPWTTNADIWGLVALEPLTLSESVMCSCGLHGYIRNGLFYHLADSVAI